MKAPSCLGICCLVVSLSSPVWAESAGAGRNGWFGDLRLGGAVVSGRPSGLEVMDDNERRESLTAKGERQARGVPIVAGEVGFGFERTGTTVSVGAGMETPLHLSLRQDGGAWGEVTLSALYREQDVWKDPYLAGESRSKTKAKTVGFSINWDRIVSTGMQLYFERMRSRVDQDLLGRLQPELRRDGTDTTVGVGYARELGAAGIINLTQRQTWIDRQGGGNSGFGYLAGLKHLLGVGRFSFATSLDAGSVRFRRTAPVFRRNREEASFAFSETLSFADPFGWQNSYLFGVAACSKTGSNIDFFDSSGVLFGTGIGYRF